MKDKEEENITQQLNSDTGRWDPAIAELYYPTLFCLIKCFFGKHVWFYKQSGMLRWLECMSCKKQIYPVGEDLK